LYHIYVDEVGNHDLTHVGDDNHRFLSLTGVIAEQQYADQVIAPELADLKARYFGGPRAGVAVVLHRADMINRRPPFEALRVPAMAQAFDAELLSALSRWDYTVITVLIDKREHCRRYQVWQYHPYHYCLAALLERYVNYLETKNDVGDVVIECRGKREDRKLQREYGRFHRVGTSFCKAARFNKHLCSKALTMRRKCEDIPGLQVADVIAHPSYRHIVEQHGLVPQPARPHPFGDQIAEILGRFKYRRNGYGVVTGYGTKVLP